MSKNLEVWKVVAKEAATTVVAWAVLMAIYHLVFGLDKTIVTIAISVVVGEILATHSTYKKYCLNRQ